MEVQNWSGPPKDDKKNKKKTQQVVINELQATYFG